MSIGESGPFRALTRRSIFGLIQAIFGGFSPTVGRYRAPSAAGEKLPSNGLRGVDRAWRWGAAWRLRDGTRSAPLPDGLTPHKLRHTFASVLVASGVDPGTVMDQLGHTDPAFTLRVYRHGMRRDPVERQRLRALVGIELPPVPEPARDRTTRAPRPSVVKARVSALSRKPSEFRRWGLRVRHGEVDRLGGWSGGRAGLIADRDRDTNALAPFEKAR